MQLLSRRLRALLPPLGSQEGHPNPMVHARFFRRGSNQTWLVIEGSSSRDDFVFFGYVTENPGEWRYIALSQLESECGQLRQRVKRDLRFKSQPFKEVLKHHKRTKKEQK